MEYEQREPVVIVVLYGVRAERAHSYSRTVWSRSKQREPVVIVVLHGVEVERRDPVVVVVLNEVGAKREPVVIVVLCVVVAERARSYSRTVLSDITFAGTPYRPFYIYFTKTMCNHKQ